MDLIAAAVFVPMILWVIERIGFIWEKTGVRVGNARTAILDREHASIDQRVSAKLDNSRPISKFNFAKKNAQFRPEAAQKASKNVSWEVKDREWV